MKTEPTDLEKAIEYLTPISEHPTMTGEYCKYLKITLSALRAQQEREKGCEYCDFSSGSTGACMGNAGDNFILIQSENGVSIATDDSYFKMLNIAFCPNCGRKLGHEPSDGGATKMNDDKSNNDAKINQCFAEPYVCPVCSGKGVVPNDFYDTHGNFSSPTVTMTDGAPKQCQSCNGTGVLWR